MSESSIRKDVPRRDRFRNSHGADCGLFVTFVMTVQRSTVRDEGSRRVNPFLTKKRVWLRVRNFETTHLKVNDRDGNPI